MVCFLCNVKFEGGEKTYSLFDNRICEADGQIYSSISVLLESTLGTKLDENVVHSKMLCDQCTNLIYFYEEIQDEHSRLKCKITEMYNETTKLHNNEIICEDNTEDDSDLIQFLVTSIPENILEIPAEENLNEKTDTSDIKYEDVSCEQIIDSPFTNHENVEIEFSVPMNLYTDVIEDAKSELLNENAEEIDAEIIAAISTKDSVTYYDKSSTEGKPFSCDLCSVTFAHRKNLSTHKRTIHMNGKEYKCNQCDCCFSRKVHLECHIRSSHTGERPFKCKTCNSSFAYPHIYARHLKIHSDVKYSCDICGKQFNSRDNRNAHSFVHSEKKRYECFECGLAVMQKSVLQTHIQNTGHKNIIVVNQPPSKSENDDKTASNISIVEC